MARNKLTDLNNHLFEQLERLNDDELSAEGLDIEIKRATAMANIGGTIIQNARLALDAQKHQDEYGRREVSETPEMFRIGKVDGKKA